VSFLLDTNVVSEWAKQKPDPGVISWLVEADEDRLFLSAITLAELRRGIERLPAGRRRAQLDEWVRHDLPTRFEGRILAVDVAVADAWGRLVARRESAGRTLHVMDGFIAAIATVHGLTLVTRNVADFDGTVPEIVNPWRVGA